MRNPRLETVVVAALVLVGLWVVLALVGTASWPVLIGWVIGWLCVAAGLHALADHRWVRLAAACTLVPLCVVLTWEGGLFFLPAAAVLATFEALAVRTPRAERPPQTGSTP